MSNKLTHWFKEVDVNTIDTRGLSCFYNNRVLRFCLHFIYLYFGTCILFVGTAYVLPSKETEYLFFLAIILGISIDNVVISRKQEHW